MAVPKTVASEPEAEAASGPEAASAPEADAAGPAAGEAVQEQRSEEATTPAKTAAAVGKRLKCKTSARDVDERPTNAVKKLVPKSALDARLVKPSMCHEGSRSQYLVRSGALGLPSVTFKYDSEKRKAIAQEKARKQLARWSDDHAKKL